MNDLQHISYAKQGPVLVTLNAPFEPAPDKVVGRWKYEHPVLDAKVSLRRLLITNLPINNAYRPSAPKSSSS